MLVSNVSNYNTALTNLYIMTNLYTIIDPSTITMVEAHGGTIEAMPAGDTGTRFAFTLEPVETEA